MNHMDLRFKKAGTYAAWSLGILLCTILSVDLILRLAIVNDLTGYLLLFLLTVCPLISLILAILAIHNRVRLLSIMALVLSVLAILFEIAVVFYTIWMIDTMCDAMTGPLGDEILEILRGCGEIG